MSIVHLDDASPLPIVGQLAQHASTNEAHRAVDTSSCGS